MQDSAFDSPAFTSPTFSPGFVLLNRRPQSSVVVDTRFKMPSSGIISTVNDLTRFASALIDKRLLPEAMFREMTTAVLVILPERRVSVALLANRERFVPGVMPIVREALRAALGLPSE